MPVVSVIIPTYNRAYFLAEAIQCVLKQTFTDFELLVIDDGSTDHTSQLVALFKSDKRVRYFYQENKGGAAARNTGIRNSSGDYLAFLDSDDLWLTDKLECQVDILRRNPAVNVVFTAALLDRLDDQRQVVLSYVIRMPVLQEKTLYEALLYDNVVTGSSSSVMARREALEQLGGFDEMLLISDRDMWQRLAEINAFYYLNTPLVRIRRHAANVSDNTEMMAESNLQIMSKLANSISPQYRHHIHHVYAYRFMLSSYAFLRRRKLRAARRAGWIALRHFCQRPNAIPSVAVRLFRIKASSKRTAESDVIFRSSHE